MLVFYYFRNFSLSEDNDNQLDPTVVLNHEVNLK